MPWYVYGIVRDGDAPPPAVTGLDDRPVQLIVDGVVAAAVSVATDHVRGLEGAEPEAVLAGIRTHDDAVAALARDRAILPVRFGTVLSDDDAVHDLLHEGAWAAQLDHVAGADEWVLAVIAHEQVAHDGEPSEELSPGHAFFARRRSEATARQEARRRAVAIAEELHAELLEIARDWRVLDLREPDVVARGAYLLPRGAVDRVERAAASVADATVALQGPLPPYRFVDR